MAGRMGIRTRNVVLGLRERFLLDFIFVHINKTGGSSVEKALGLRLDHSTALERRAKLGAAEWESRFTFTIVRNPWDKVLSHYAYRLRTEQTNLGSRPVDFRTWVRLAYGEQDPSYYDKPKMFMPQFRWISDEDGRIIVDFIGRFERLEADFAKVCDRIGRTTTLPHLKASPRGDYRGAYDDEAAEIVASRFAQDVEAFGYRF
jgi:chondroitin 4-sulfotransferase 11